jgi:hypothetical protein
MKSLNCCLVTALILFTGMLPCNVTAEEMHVVAQDLQNLRIPGKVVAVVWTRRNDSCTVQVVLQMPVEYQLAAKRAAQLAAAGAGAPLASPRLPQVQVWMLKADGKVVSRTAGSPAFPAAVKASDGVPLEMKYSYPLSAAQEAVAVAIEVDGVYYIDQLQPFQ